MRRAVEEFSELGDHLSRPVKRLYSSGMLARLSVSIALNCDPELLILDEVLSVGDLNFRFRCREQIARIADEGATVVMVSHDLSMIADLCDRAVLLEAGRVVADGALGVVEEYLGGLLDGSTSETSIDLSVANPVVRPGERIDLDAGSGSVVAGRTSR